MRRILCLVGVSLWLTACGSPEKDLDQICEIVTRIHGDKSKSKAQKNVAIVKEVGMSVSTAEVKALLEKVAKKPKKKRYKFLKKSARKLGVKKWSCPKAKKWLATL